jgi:hypothetical protein
MAKQQSKQSATAIADQVAAATEDAYSFDRYGATNWLRACRMLARRGYNAREIEAFMRSKHTRWAGDTANKNSGVTAKDLEAYISKCIRHEEQELAQLVAETFEGEAEQNPREKGDDDGVEYGDPRDERDSRRSR